MVQDCVFARTSEFKFGVRRKNLYNPGLAGSEFGERMGITLVQQVWRKVSSFLRTLAGSEFRVRTGPKPDSAGAEVGLFLSPNTAGSEFRERTGPNPGSAGSEKGQFLSPNPGRFGVRRKDRAEPWFGRFGERTEMNPG